MSYAFIPETRNLIRALAATAFTASPGPADSTRSRLNDKRIDKPFVMVPATTGITLAVDLGVAASPNTAALLNHNFAGVGTTRSITVEGADDAAFSVNLVAAAVASLDPASPRPKDTSFSWAPFSRRYWRFIFAWTGGGLGTISIGEVVLGVATVLTRGELDGSGETERVRAPMVELSNGAGRSIFIAGPVLERSLVFSEFTEAQRDILRTMWRDCRGSAVPLLWVEDWVATPTLAVVTEPRQRCLYGHLQMPEFSWRWSDWLLVKPPDIVIRSQGREVGA
jgi:hypothetical protein